MKTRRLMGWISGRSHAVLDEALGSFVLTALAFAAGRHLGRYVFSAVIVVVLAVSGVLLCMRLRPRSHKRVVVVGQISRPDYMRLALSHYLYPDRNLEDRIHRFDLIDQRFTIDGTDGTFEFRYDGENAGTVPSRTFRDVVSGDSRADLRLMQINATDLTSGKSMVWSAKTDEPYCKVIDFVFPQPIPPGGRFSIQWSCRWLGTYTTMEDYAFFTLGIRCRGTALFIGSVILSARPNYVEGIRYNGRVMTTELAQPELSFTGPRTRISWRIPEPVIDNGNAYAIDFGRGDSPSRSLTRTELQSLGGSDLGNLSPS